MGLDSLDVRGMLMLKVCASCEFLLVMLTKSLAKKAPLLLFRTVGQSVCQTNQHQYAICHLPFVIIAILASSITHVRYS